MTHRIDFTIGPVPAARPRVTKQGWSYYPKPYKLFKDELNRLAKAQWTEAPIATPFDLVIHIRAERPKTTKLDFPKPDVDNYAKAVMDALNEVVWDDDWLCRRLVIEKEWAAKGSISVQITPR